MDQRTFAVLKKHFGPEMKLKPLFSGSVRIITPDGEIELRGKTFKNIIGGQEMYRAFLPAAYELWDGPVQVEGSSQHIMAAMAHGKELGIPIKPRKPVNIRVGCVAFIFAGMIFCVGMIVFGIFAHDLDPGALAFSAAAIAGVVVYCKLSRELKRAALLNAQKYRDIFPETHGSPRRADHNLARSKGLLGPSNHS